MEDDFVFEWKTFSHTHTHTCTYTHTFPAHTLVEKSLLYCLK